jgi:hypothetical protein
MAGQLALSMPRQPRNSRAEDRGFHEAVIAARKAGNSVYRAGRKTVLINGHRMPRGVMGGAPLKLSEVGR